MPKKRTKKQDVPVIGQRFITSDELLKIKVAIERVNNIQMQIGGMEAQKSELIASMKEKVMDLNKLKVELESNYGDVVLDLSNGEIKDNVPNTKN
jgi:hypothetical protein